MGKGGSERACAAGRTGAGANTVLERNPGQRLAAAHRLKLSKLKISPKRKTIRVGSFQHSDQGGSVHLHFTGRVKGHPLGKGSYKLKAVPVNGAGAGKPLTVSFTISG